MSVINYDNPGSATFPMPALWKDCRLETLNDQGLGWYFFDRFQSFTPLSTQVDMQRMSEHTRFTGDLDCVTTVIDDGRYGGLNLATNTTAGDGGAIVTRPLGNMVKNSGNKLWFETRVAPGDVDDDMGTFFGLVELDGANHDIIADDPAADTSVADQSLIGFYQNNANPDAFNIVTKIAGETLVTVATDVTNATAIPAESRASLTDGTFHRLGIRFDGRETVEFYVNGYKVATANVSTVDQTQDYCGIDAVKTGDAAAESVAISYMRAAFQEQS